MKKLLNFIIFTGLLLIASSFSLSAQSRVNPDTIINAALEIIHETQYCALVTLDADGRPGIRTMNPFPMQDRIEIWFATSRSSRKVTELKNDPRVSVYWADHTKATGYVSITGTAEVIDDEELLIKMKRDYWEGIPNWKEIFVLIRIVPKTIEVINYKHGLHNDPVTFKAPEIEL